MTKQVKILFSLGVFLIAIGLITNFTMSFSADKEEVAKRMKKVDKNYEIFKREATNFSNTRDSLYDTVFAELYFETLNLTINNCLI